MKTLTQKLIALFLSLPLLSACSGANNITIQNYAKNSPTLDIFDYFEGNTKGWGMFQDRKGTLKRQFVVDLKGTINDAGQLVLEEDFVWSDGEISKRIWTITKENTNQFSGEADDIDGVAKGASAGNALNWKYVMKLPVGDKTYKIKFDDWMFLQPNGILLNKAKMSKFGFSVGEVIISFQKQQSE